MASCASADAPRGEAAESRCGTGLVGSRSLSAAPICRHVWRQYHAARSTSAALASAAHGTQHPDLAGEAAEHGYITFHTSGNRFTAGEPCPVNCGALAWL